MPHGLTATATITIAADRSRVWQAFVDPAAIKEYMFGTTVRTEWTPGSPITWSGEWNGKPYEDKGTIIECRPGDRLAYTHFSPLTGAEDVPENYHTVTVDFAEDEVGTRVTLEQDGNASEEEREHSRQNWETMLSAVKAYVERSA